MAFRTLDPCCLLSPVPAVLVGSRGTEADALPNLITIAWAGTVCSDPAMVSVSIRPSRYSHGLIRESGEFTVNLPTAAMAEQVDLCGVRSGRELDKWQACSFTPVQAPGLSHAPAVAECPVSLACRVQQVIPLGSHDLFLGQVTGVLVAEECFDPQGGLHLEQTKLLTYTHGIYQQAEGALGFFGYSIARPEVRKRRMEALQG